MQLCPNCNEELDSSYKFCPSCGQKNVSDRLKVQHVMHEFSHAILHTDRSIVYLIGQLLFRPGYVARNYVFGKRKSYFSPFNFLVLIGALSVFILSISPVDVFGPQTDRGNAFITKHYNLIVFFTVPVLAYTTYLFFRRKGFNFAECAVLATYTAGMRSLFFTFIILPLEYLLPAYGNAIVGSYMLIYFIYYGLAAAQFSGHMSAVNFFRGLGAVVIMQVFVGIIIHFGMKVF